MRTSLFHFAPLMVVVVLILGMISMGHSQPRLQTDFRQGIDSLRVNGMSHQMLDDMLKRNGHQAIRSPHRKVASPQSQLYVIDTAIVLSSRGTTRHLYSFNLSDKKTCDLTQKLASDMWMDTLRQTNTYDASKNMLTYLYEVWSDGQWVGQYRYTYTYDASGNRLTELDELWLNGQWVNCWRYTYTYDASGNKLSDWLEMWLNGQWVGQYRYTYTYDANGNMLTDSGERWSNGEWSTESRSSYTYDANGHMLTELYELFVWDYFTGGQWSSQCRYTWTYDENGKRLTYLYEGIWNGQWFNLVRGSCTYDANGHMLTDVYEYWTGIQWVGYYSFTYAYDAHGNVTSVYFPGEGVKYPQTWSTTDNAGNKYSYSGGYNVTLTWKLIVTGVSAEGKNGPEIYTLHQNYPNPFNSSSTIKYELPRAAHVTLTVYDVLGREVATLVNETEPPGFKSVKFNANNLASGVYFYRLTAGDFVQTKRLLLLK